MFFSGPQTYETSDHLHVYVSLNYILQGMALSNCWFTNIFSLRLSAEVSLRVEHRANRSAVIEDNFAQLV